MKKILLSALFLLPFLSSAQSFVLTPQGFKSEKDNTLDYVTIDAPGQTASQLFSKVFESYKTLGLLKDTEHNKQIQINAQSDKTVVWKTFGASLTFDLVYVIVLDFKDNLIEMRLQDITLPPDNPSLNPNPYMVGAVYNKKGKLKDEDTKKALEAHFLKDILLVKEALAK